MVLERLLLTDRGKARQQDQFDRRRIELPR